MPVAVAGAKLLKLWGNTLVQPSRMVTFGDRKDFLHVLRMEHFRRKCSMRKTCKRDTSRGSAGTGLLPPLSQKSHGPAKTGRLRRHALPLFGARQIGLDRWLSG